MLIPEPQRYRHSDENLLPMINIIFLLLIFFMIAGSIAATDTLDLVAIQSTAGNESETQANPLLLDLTGTIHFGRIQTHLQDDSESTQQRIKAEYILLFSDSEQTTLPPLPVKADATVTSAQLAKLMRLLEGAGIEKIRLMTEAKP